MAILLIKRPRQRPRYLAFVRRAATAGPVERQILGELFCRPFCGGLAAIKRLMECCSVDARVPRPHLIILGKTLMKSINYIAVVMAAFLVLLLGATPLCAEIQVYTTDFIPNHLRTNFNSFEAFPPTPPPVPPNGVPGLSIEDGVRVEQSSGAQITSLWWWSGNVGDPQPPDGSRSWYPSGGDHGYTKITREDSSDFRNVGFVRGSGQPGFDVPGIGTLLYELYENGGFVLGGSVSHTQLGQYLGFSGGGFDEIRVRDGEVGVVQSFYDNTRNALALDAIELSSVPEPSSLALIGLAVAGLIGRRLNRRRRSRAISWEG